MERYKSTHGKVYISAMAALALVMILGLVSAILWMSGISRIVMSIVYVAIILIEVWIYFGTYYEFGEDALLCKCGPFSETVAYKRIKTATKCKGYMFSMALSEIRIELRYGKSDVSGTVFISPVNEDEFLEKLSQKCEKMAVMEA